MRWDCRVRPGVQPGDFWKTEELWPQTGRGPMLTILSPQSPRADCLTQQALCVIAVSQAVACRHTAPGAGCTQPGLTMNVICDASAACPGALRMPATRSGSRNKHSMLGAATAADAAYVVLPVRISNRVFSGLANVGRPAMRVLHGTLGF